MGEVAELKKQRKNTARHIQASELSEEDQFRRLSTQSKHFIDTIKMIAYRAETAMVHVLREKMSRHDDGRSLLRAIYETEADLLPNESDQTLTVRLHHLASKSSGNALQHICAELNAAEIVFPGTNLRMVYELLGEQNRAGKDV